MSYIFMLNLNNANQPNLKTYYLSSAVTRFYYIYIVFESDPYFYLRLYKLGMFELKFLMFAFRDYRVKVGFIYTDLIAFGYLIS
jgi:hypothetical protein